MKKRVSTNYIIPAKNETKPLVEGIDYYISEALYVFTAKYLLERGACCKNGCANCPYPAKIVGVEV